jgi:hypothetical protein
LIIGGLEMGEESIKKIMDERFGVNQVPRRQVSNAEMDNLIAEAKERGKIKNEMKQLSRDEQRAEETGSPKVTTDSHKTPAQVSQRDEAETGVDKINQVNEPITETGNDGRIFCEYRCNDCQEIVVACGNSIEKAKTLVAFHKNCGGRLIFVRQVNLKVYGNEERFSHPRIEKAICNGCFHDMECPRTFQRMVLCLLSGIDYKIKKLGGG